MSKCTAIYWWLWKVSNNDDECLEQHPSFWQRTKKKNILHFDRRRRREMKVYREDETTLCWCTILLLTCLCRKKGGYYKVGHWVRWLVWGWMIVIVLNADFNYIKTNRLMQSFWQSFWISSPPQQNSGIVDIFCFSRVMKTNGRSYIPILIPCHVSPDILACSSRWKVNSGSFESWFNVE